MPYYSVANGHSVGVFETWSECKKNIDGFSKPRFKKFDTKEEAEQFIKEYNEKKICTELIELDKDTIYIFTDGACSNNGQKDAKAGIGIYFGDKDKRNVSEKVEGKQTNNTAELTAIKRTLEITKNETKKICICTDSEYSIKCCTSYGKKLEEGTIKKEIPNKELVKDTYELAKRENISFKYVEAHTEREDFFSIGNKKADMLANKAIGLESCPYNVERIYLNVKYAEKEEAKKLGARWCPEKKSWYYNETIEKEKQKKLDEKYGI